MTDHAPWRPVCALADILPMSGVAALIDGTQIALVRWSGDRVHALANQDPFSGAMVLSRGLVGDCAGAAFIASPLHKQRFRLEDGVCLEDPAVRLPTWPTRVVDGQVEVRFTG